MTHPRSARHAPQHPGFTVIELLISLSIFALLLVLILANFRTGSYNDELRFTADRFVGNLRRVQNLATIGQALFYDGEDRVPPGGYGISIPSVAGVWVVMGDETYQSDVNHYTMFADFQSTVDGVCENEPNQLYDDGNGVRTCNGDREVEAGIVSFPSNVKRTAIRVSGCPVGVTEPIDITFKPPRPTPLILGCSGTVSIELTHAKTEKCRTVTINAISGQISQRPGSLRNANTDDDCNVSP